MDAEAVRQQLAEASALLEILDVYCAKNGRPEAPEENASAGIHLLIKETRERIESARRHLQVSGRAMPRSYQSLASRIKRLPEGEYRTVELELDPLEQVSAQEE